MSRPRSACSSASDAASRSRPSNAIAPRRSALSGSRLRIDIAVTLLPEPDSPTSATVRVLGHLEAHADARRGRPPRCAARRRLRGPGGRRRAGRGWPAACVAHSSPRSFGSSASRSASVMQREGGDEDRHEERRRGELPPVAEDQLALRLGEHRAPRHVVDADAEAEVRQDHLELDEADHEQRHAHQDHVADVRQDVAEHARRGRRADRLRGAHVVARRVLDELGAHQAIDAGPADQRRGSSRRCRCRARRSPRTRGSAGCRGSR